MPIEVLYPELFLGHRFFDERSEVKNQPPAGCSGVPCTPSSGGTGRGKKFLDKFFLVCSYEYLYFM